MNKSRNKKGVLIVLGKPDWYYKILEQRQKRVQINEAIKKPILDFAGDFEF